MNINGAIAAGKAFTEALNDNVVQAVEILRRADVCVVCPKREPVSGARSRVSRLLGNIANKHRVPAEIKDYRCGVCQCALVLLLPAKKEDLHVDSKEEAAIRPKTCWMTKI